MLATRQPDPSRSRGVALGALAALIGAFLLVPSGIAVAVDAIVVRMVIGPALLRLAGRWNWWPGHVSEPHPARAES